ncbi:MAG: DUF4394 domain-containing protein, partial [Chitinophagaceae bacterium]|nr:DUF4394 domain-containing protein [Chitinophagaceae bacterium]
MNLLHSRAIHLSVVLLMFISFFTACKKDNVPANFPTSSLDVNFYALTPDNRILKLNAKTGSTINASANITGLPGGVNIVSIDFRPATGQLYGLGSDSRLYVINYDNGSAIAIGSGSFSPAIVGSATIDFNPTVDRIRLVTNSGQNLRLHPETGVVVAVDGSISNPSFVPGIVATAYTNNIAGASTTQLYDIGVNAHTLYLQSPPNDGTISEVGANPLDVPFEGQVGFDINADNSIALASFNIPGNNSKLFTIDLKNGSASFVV